MRPPHIGAGTPMVAGKLIGSLRSARVGSDPAIE
jgi:hypothetical protein